MIAFVSVYARRTGEFSAGEISLLLGLATIFAVAGALLAGRAMERVGPRNVLIITLVAAAVALFAIGLTGLAWLLWAAAPVVGTAIGSVTAADRVYLLRLIEPERRGEVFGLYALVGRISNGFGALVLWGGTIALVTQVLAFAGPYGASTVAVCVLALTALGGMLVLRGLPDVRDPAPGGDEARA